MIGFSRSGKLYLLCVLRVSVVKKIPAPKKKSGKHELLISRTNFLDNPPADVIVR
jgi:hypothetical protein